MAKAEMEMRVNIVKRPEILGKPVPMYEREDSTIPEKVRVSFMDGTTAIYELPVEQPAPVIFENIKIIRRMKVGYKAATKHEYRPRRRNRT